MIKDRLNYQHRLLLYQITFLYTLQLKQQLYFQLAYISIPNIQNSHWLQIFKKFFENVTCFSKFVKKKYFKK